MMSDDLRMLEKILDEQKKQSLYLQKIATDLGDLLFQIRIKNMKRPEPRPWWKFWLPKE